MGLNDRTNSLMINGPITIKSREEVIESVVKKIAELNPDVTTEAISTIFTKVHSDFKINALDYIKPIPEAFDFVKSCHSNNLSLYY